MRPLVSATKIFNDPVYGFISVSDPVIQKLIDHPWFQRLSRISQGGFLYLVYPGAHHTRFHHALGAMHLMQEAIEVFRTKGVEITDEEARGAKIAILLHDIGHGPFSHTLEQSIITEMTHEEISSTMMQLLNEEFHHELEIALRIFHGDYHRKFIHQLVSGQLDTDRMDYLMRDSFYTGVAEGVIGSERIIKMMNVVDDELVIEEKGIYSVEKFLIARRLMYWQVYLHKTVLGAERLLLEAIRRAKELAASGENVFVTSALRPFFYPEYGRDIKTLMSDFAHLDDHDIFTCLKEWQLHPDTILSDLCRRLINRQLFKIRIQKEPFTDKELDELQEEVTQRLNLNTRDSEHYVIRDQVSIKAYDPAKDTIRILMKSGKVVDVFEASAHLDRDNMEKDVTRYFVCYPKEIERKITHI